MAWVLRQGAGGGNVGLARAARGDLWLGMEVWTSALSARRGGKPAARLALVLVCAQGLKP